MKYIMNRTNATAYRIPATNADHLNLKINPSQLNTTAIPTVIIWGITINVAKPVPIVSASLAVEFKEEPKYVNKYK